MTDILPLQDLDSLLEPEQDPPHFSATVLDRDLFCFPEVELHCPKLDQLPQTQLPKDMCYNIFHELIFELCNAKTN